jgi:hypothetical protein
MTDLSKPFRLPLPDRAKLLGLVGVAGALALGCGSNFQWYGDDALENHAGAAGTSSVRDHDGQGPESTHTVHVVVASASSPGSRAPRSHGSAGAGPTLGLPVAVHRLFHGTNAQ